MYLRACTIEITAVQSLHIHGLWAQPRTTVAWEDLRISELTWKQLRDLDFTAQELKDIQSDPGEWITRGKVQLSDLRDMIVFPVNPFSDFRADLSEVWSMKFTINELLKMKVTYHQFRLAGMTDEIMIHFNFSLSQWHSLGMGSVDVATVPSHKSVVLFGVDKETLIQQLVAFEQLKT